MTFGNEQTTAKALERKHKELESLNKRCHPRSPKIERVEAEIALLEMGITPNTNLEMS